MKAEKFISLVVNVLCASAVFLSICAQNAPQGRVTEALFILQDKRRKLSDSIESLKKRLTDCLVQQKKLLDCTSKKGDPTLLELSHCALYQKLFPIYIKELQLLERQLLDRIATFSLDDAIKDSEVKKTVDRAFLVHEKIELEFLLIDQLVALNTKQWEIQHKQNGTRPKRGLDLQNQRFLKMQRDSDSDKRLFKKRKTTLSKINSKLYEEKDLRPEKTFLDELNSYIS